ncbi:MAG: hypothetical protein ROO76_23815 [Terriglobia bacterium]|jgi:hypothetical protein|nr:hypothetical protein [Terriglobia bacterium]
MKGAGGFALGLFVGVAAIVVPRVAGIDVVAHFHQHFARRSEDPIEHTEAKFEFVANGPMEKVAPLMGADRERVWAPGWNPHFVFPNPTADQEGMVFTVAHGPYRVPWVNTEFDLKAGRVQYVYVIPDTLVTVITIRLTPEGEKTNVAVEYDRTALSAGANKHVRQLAEHDRGWGPEWQEQINAWLVREGSR